MWKGALSWASCAKRKEHLNRCTITVDTRVPSFFCNFRRTARTKRVSIAPRCNASFRLDDPLSNTELELVEGGACWLSPRNRTTDSIGYVREVFAGFWISTRSQIRSMENENPQNENGSLVAD